MSGSRANSLLPGHGVTRILAKRRELDIHAPGAPPVSTPPRRAVERPARRIPHSGQARRQRLQLCRQPRDDDADPPPRPKHLRATGEVELACPEVVIGVDADDRVEGLIAEREIVSLNPQRQNAILHPGRVDPAFQASGDAGTSSITRNTTSPLCPRRGTPKPCTNSTCGFGPWADRGRELRRSTSSEGRPAVRPARCRGPVCGFMT
jgi:hypothetical protein